MRTNRTILQVCAYGADYPGNFIASLEYLENELKKRGIQTIYAFVERAREKDWCKIIEKRTKVYYLPEAKARILPKTYRKFYEIYSENDIEVVHSHFELYDIPATVMAPMKARIFWHLHDPINKGHGLRRMLWRIQYGVVGKKAQMLAVSDYYRKIAISMGFPEKNTCVVLNGIELERVKFQEERLNPQYDFLTFGWDFYRKGDDTILEACELLRKDGYRFKFMLNGNEKTWACLGAWLKTKEPSYLEKGNPQRDINQLFSNSKIFIQASRKETFSYAVCEAAYAGLPVICSDIDGLEWAHSLPTVDFFAVGDATELYEKMKKHLEHEYYTKKDFLTTRRMIEEKLSLEVWTQKVISCYDIC